MLVYNEFGGRALDKFGRCIREIGSAQFSELKPRKATRNQGKRGEPALESHSNRGELVFVSSIGEQYL